MDAVKFPCINKAFQLQCGALHRIRPALNTHRHDNIKSHKICPFYHVSSIKICISEKYFHQCTKDKDF